MRSSRAAARFLPTQHVRANADELQLGMHVCALDRPWTDTPFPVHGFRIDSDIELVTIRRYCRHVFVDLDRSEPASVDLLRTRALIALENDLELDPATRPIEAVPYVGRLMPASSAVRTGGALVGVDADPAPGRAGHPPASTQLAPDVTSAPDRAVPGPAVHERMPLRADVRITAETRERFRRLVRGQAGHAGATPADDGLAKRALSRLRALLPGSRGAEPAEDTPPDPHAVLRDEIVAALPAGAALRGYVDRRSVVEELPRARAAIARAEDAVAAVVARVRAGRSIASGRVEEAAVLLVDSAADSADALQWPLQVRSQHRPTPELAAVRFAVCMVVLGRQLGLPRTALCPLAMIGMLADVGKSRLPRALLEKPGMLTPAEYSIVREHVRLGLDLVSAEAKLPDAVVAGIAAHHERLDGSGYPKAIAGAQIGLWGRMAAIADNYAAMVAARPYAHALAPQDALMNLFQWGGTLFDLALVERFVEAIGAFPVGSLVELSTGEIAVVLSAERQRRLQPRVRVLAGSDRQPLSATFVVDLQQPLRGASGQRRRVIRGLPAGAHGLRLLDRDAD